MTARVYLMVSEGGTVRYRSSAKRAEAFDKWHKPWATWWLVEAESADDARDTIDFCQRAPWQGCTEHNGVGRILDSGGAK